MGKYLQTLIVVIALVALPTTGFALNLAGKWQTSIMGYKIKAKVNKKGKRLDGVVHIYDWFGKKNTYHFKGSVENGNITAAHYQGHTFRGRVTSRGTVVGVLRTRQGHRVPVNVSPRR